jgi:hypothetical protein
MQERPAILRRARQPPGGRGGGSVAAAFELEAIVIMVESAREAVPAIEYERADERAGLIPGVAERGRQRRQALAEHEVAVVAHAVAEGIQPGEQAGVRRQRERSHRERALEHHTPGGQAIEARRARLAISVRAYPVGACRVERDQQDVRRRGRPSSRSDNNHQNCEHDDGERRGRKDCRE